MKKVIIILFFFATSLNAQSFYDNRNLYTSYSRHTNYSLKELKKTKDKGVLKYSKKEFNSYKDSLQILSKIHSVKIYYTKNTDTDSIINDLLLLKNLKTVMFEKRITFKRNQFTLTTPTNLYKLKQIKTIVFKGVTEWDYNLIFDQLATLNNLKNLAFITSSKKKIAAKNFNKLNFLEGLLFNYCDISNLINTKTKFNNLKTLILYGRGTYLNKNIYKFKNIKTIENLALGFGKFEDSTLVAIKNFTNLKKISFRNSAILNLKKTFTQLAKNHKIKELNLINNTLTNLPKEIGLLDSLEVFKSSSNKFATLPKEFYLLKNLKSLTIYGSKIDTISNSLNNFNKLETLNLGSNNIKKLPQDYSNLKKLKTINLYNNKLKTIPKTFGKLTSLEKLFLDNNNLTLLPESLSKLNQLKHLGLGDNKLIKIPKNIGDLKELKILILRNNFLEKLPNSITKLTKLESLDVSNNNLKELPKSIGKLKNIKYLHLRSNLLEKLPNSIVKLTKIFNLDLFQNNLTSLPKKIGNLINLESISIRNLKKYQPKSYTYNASGAIQTKKTPLSLKPFRKNNITKLPNSITKLSKLKRLNFSYNKNIDSKRLFNLLKKSSFSEYSLSLDGCDLKELPQDGWKNITVKYLQLNENKISKLPKDIIHAKYLSTLSISGIKGGNLNTYRKNKEELQLLFEEEGLITANEQPKTDKMALAYAQVVSKKHSAKQYKKAIAYANRALKINPTLANEKLNFGDLTESYFKTKNYKKSLYYANKAIQRDTSFNMRVINFILPNFRYKTKSHLILGDTLKAIQSINIASSRFSDNQWSFAGVLAKKIGKDSLASIYFNKSYDFYKNYLKQKPKSLGYQLSLLEAYIVAEDMISTKEYLTFLDNENIQDKNYKTLLDYFHIIYAVILNIDTSFSKEYIALKNKINTENISLKTWSFQLLNDWNKLNNLTATQKEKINKLTTAFSK